MSENKTATQKLDGTPKHPKGSKENPHKTVDDFDDIEELLEGWNELWAIERGIRTESLYTTKKEAKAALAYMEEGLRNSWVITQNREWTRANVHNRKQADLMQFKVTDKTTKKEIESYHADMLAMRDRLKANPAAKMPKFKKSDAVIPDLKIVKWLVFLEKTEV